MHNPIYTAVHTSASEPRRPNAHATRMHRLRSGLRPRTRTCRTPSCAPGTGDADRSRFGSRRPRTSRAAPSEGCAHRTHRMRANGASAREPQGACAGARGGQRGAGCDVGMVRARLVPREHSRARGFKSVLLWVVGCAISYSSYACLARKSLSWSFGGRGARGRRVGRLPEGVTTCSSENRGNTVSSGGCEKGSREAAWSNAVHVERQERVGHAGIIRRGAMRSFAQGACGGDVGHAAHLRGK